MWGMWRIFIFTWQARTTLPLLWMNYMYCIAEAFVWWKFVLYTSTLISAKTTTAKHWTCKDSNLCSTKFTTTQMNFGSQSTTTSHFNTEEMGTKPQLCKMETYTYYIHINKTPNTGGTTVDWTLDPSKCCSSGRTCMYWWTRRYSNARRTYTLVSLIIWTFLIF
jgi:hypothetical protein